MLLFCLLKCIYLYSKYKFLLLLDMDIVGKLSERSLLSHVAKSILIELDALSLLNCEQVSTEWFDLTSSIWKEFFHKQKKSKTLFQKYFELRQFWVDQRFGKISQNEKSTLVKLQKTLCLKASDPSLC